MRINRLHPQFFGEVVDLDLSQSLHDDQVAVLQRAIDEHAVLVFRDQQAMFFLFHLHSVDLLA